MPWLKVLHIVAIAIWCGLLLYLPAMVATNSQSRPYLTDELDGHAFARHVFTLAATPAALLAIFTGTLLFLIDTNIAGWMIMKLIVVTGLVLCHTICGFLVLRAERHPDRSRAKFSIGLAVAMSAFMISILWLVLARPI